MVSSANSTKATSLVLSVPDDANDIGRGCFGFSFLSKLEPSNTRQPARLMPSAAVVAGLSRRTCYLVDPASSLMLVSKIKPAWDRSLLLFVGAQLDSVLYMLDAGAELLQWPEGMPAQCRGRGRRGQ